MARKTRHSRTKLARTATRCGAPQRMRFTPELFHRLGELGVFNDDLRYELIEGDIYAVPPEGTDHALVKGAAIDLFYERTSSRWHRRVKSPLRLGENELIPDLAIVPGQRKDYANQHPETALLVVEVASTSLEHDRERKLPLYAQHSIPECWIVNLMERVLEVYREPEGTRYKYQRVYTLDESVRPLFEPDWAIPVRRLFE